MWGGMVGRGAKGVDPLVHVKLNDCNLNDCNLDASFMLHNQYMVRGDEVGMSERGRGRVSGACEVGELAKKQGSQVEWIMDTRASHSSTAPHTHTSTTLLTV